MQWKAFVEFIKKNLKDTGTAVLGGIGYVLYYRKELVKALLFPVAVVMCLDLLVYLIPDDWMILVWVLYALALLAYSVLAITVHRIVLLGPGSVPEWGIWRLSARELRFAAYLIAYYLLSTVIMLPMMVLLMLLPTGALAPLSWSDLFIAIWGLFSAFVIARFVLVFPGTAVGQDPTFPVSWQVTRPHMLMVFLVGMAAPALTMLVTELLQAVPLVRYLTPLVDMIMIIIIAAMLSVTFGIIKARSE